jgi:hypothetical protein
MSKLKFSNKISQQFRVSKDKKKADKSFLDSQERAFWSIARPLVNSKVVKIFSYFHLMLYMLFIYLIIHFKNNNYPVTFQVKPSCYIYIFFLF